MNIIIAPYTPADRAAVIKGNIDLQETERKLSQFCLPGIDIGELYLDHLLMLNSLQKGIILVARIGNVVVGFISCRIEIDESVTTTDELNTHGYISDAWTHPEFRKQGIFTALNQAAEEYLRQFPEVRIIRLNVLAGNTAALAAYENTGYQIQELALFKRI
jgi:ribosomal protein S18 acetylase RimI-like enzyme